MYTALDGYGRTVSIEEANNRTKYLCKYCMSELILKNQGTIRAHHFAHKAGSHCSDSWVRERVYDEISDWHKNWQGLFPPDNQEVTLAFGGIRHRGDVVTGRTVIEFQHSPLSHKNFDKRTNFYHNCECKVIWLFDLMDDYECGKIYSSDADHFTWTNTWRTFNYLDDLTGMVDVFFQLKEDVDDRKCIIRIKNIEGENFERFEIGQWYSREEFLDYVGRKEGKYPLPDLAKIDQDPKYLQLKNDYGLRFDAQQERAIQKIDGVTLLLAVPGSGKTTTLIGRLGYMTVCKGIDPKNILAITYSRAGTFNMRERFCKRFGNEIGEQISFKTINGFCYEIVRRVMGKQNVCNEKEQRSLLRELFLRINFDEFPQESDLMNASSYISYVKNLMINADEIKGLRLDVPNFDKIYKAYCDVLKSKHQIDFDDQMVLALDILKKNPKLLNEYQERYRYICVDEAQDTSKLQHEILKLLCCKYSNLFLVGDEDQSIYGYRGAFPQALLDIRNNYNNPFVLKLETNYRSKEEIVKVASGFIERNPNRIEKDMIADRGKGGRVQFISVEDRLDQFDQILNICKQNSGELAVIYRNNDSALPLVDLFERNNISFSINNYKDTFFTNRVVTDIRSFLNYALDTNNRQLLKGIYYKFCFGFTKTHYEKAVYWAGRNNSNLLDEFVNQGQFYKIDDVGKDRKWNLLEYAKDFGRLFKTTATKDPMRAINDFVESGYEQYAIKKGLNIGAADLLMSIAENTETIPEFLQRLDYLEEFLKKNSKRKEKPSNGVVLSTIHSVKGLEYESVVIFDVIDGILPSQNSIRLRNEDTVWTYEEERRLFYVAMTRAKDNLTILCVDKADSEFLSEIGSRRWRCPDLRNPANIDSRGVLRLPSYAEEEVIENKTILENVSENNEVERIPDNKPYEKEEQSEKEKLEQEQKAAEGREKLELWWAQREAEALRQKELENKRLHEEEEKRKEELIKIQEEKTILHAKAESEIDAYIDKPYIDPSGRRLFKCEICGKVGGTEDFSEFGGEHKAARGICRECARAGKNMPSIEEGEICPMCGSKLIVREGKFGPSIRCSAYPRCRYIKK